MNADTWIAGSGVAVALLVGAWPVRRSIRGDRQRQIDATVERETQHAERHTRTEGRVDALAQDVSELDKRVMRLERRRDD